jgi:Uma2 family endonuclease
MPAMTAQPIPEPRRYTVQEYFDFEDTSEVKHEYFEGYLLDMSGASYDHGTISVNLIGLLYGLLKGTPCRVRESNTRVQVQKETLYSYPDVAIVCGPPELTPEDKRKGTINNPRVVFEVLSPSTEAWDRGEKFNRYGRLESLQEYVLVSQHTPRVETLFRHDDGTWLLSRFEGLEAVVSLRCMPLKIPLRDIYAEVDFAPAPPPPAPAG